MALLGPASYPFPVEIDRHPHVSSCFVQSSRYFAVKQKYLGVATSAESMVFLSGPDVASFFGLEVSLTWADSVLFPGVLIAAI